MELSLALAALTVVGATPPIKAPPMQVEVATIVISQVQPDAAVVAFEGATQSVPPEAQAEVTATATSSV